jgi:hypothetical protein
MEATVTGQTRPVLGDLSQYLCGVARPGDAIDQRRDRNGRQDAALAQGLAKRELLGRLGGCAALNENPETYLRIRDYLFRLR